MNIFKSLFLFFILLSSIQAVNIHTTDFIDNSQRTHFVAFGSSSSAVNLVYIENGVRIQQVNGQSEDGSYFPNGGYWYPNGGDYGYTKITRTDGLDFVNVGFQLYSGGGASTGAYRLYNDGVFVTGGTFSIGSMFALYVGFSGGGFDEIRVRDFYSTAPSTANHLNFYNGTPNALGLDSIELSGTSVPEPHSLFLSLLSIIALFLLRK
ncbi:MAG: hypothetical protein HUU50_06225 [Candidatus Brocadiae bacterium]|nr:hypothetical protein [Candidatus Brocadiia bacterium]